MPTWSIKIVSNGGVTSFDPPNLDAMQDDCVSWNNTTDEPHQPWQLQSKDGPPVPFTNRFATNYLADVIAPEDSSRPAYNVTLPTSPATWPIYYYCNEHPDRASERGSITGHLPGQGTTS
jgi:hypothetical protein